MSCSYVIYKYMYTTIIQNAKSQILLEYILKYFFYFSAYTYARPPRPLAPLTPYLPYSAFTARESSGTPRMARVDLTSAADSGVTGTIYLREEAPGQGVILTGDIYGLTSGLHGFHVHQDGAITDECRDAMGHFNPGDKQHGDPTSLNRHVGDLGNIYTFSSSHPTKVLILDKLLTLEPGHTNDVSNRAIVVHADEDDLGRGGNDGSLSTGNAGARVACGVITPVNY